MPAKMIEHHSAELLRKLDVHTRGEAALRLGGSDGSAPR
jgi:hypothetical protein